MRIEEKPGQLIECVNPEHWKLGSIHYIQPDCIGEKVSLIDLALSKWADSDESWQASDLRLEDMTWRCDICRRERPDAKISVHKVDIGPAGLPAGTVVRNVKYCNDNPNCHDAALNWNEDEQRRRVRS